MSKASMLKDAERSLAVRVKRIYTVTPKGGPTGTSVELDGARKDVARAEARLARAELAHSVATAEAVEYAEIVTALGGKVDFDSFMPKVEETGDAPADTNPDVEETPAETVSDQTEPLDGTPEDSPAEPEETDTKPARASGRFARRGTVV